MNELRFWEIIAHGLQTANDTEEQADLIIETLIKSPVKDIVEFQRILEKQWEKCSTAKLYAACRFILDISDEEEADDRFPNFCGWVLSLGKEAFHAAIENPDSLAPFLKKNEEGDFICECEMMMFLADNAYEMKTGEEDFYEKFDSELDYEMQGEELDKKEYAAAFPAIAALKNL